jgi:hypothetical protein
MILDDLKFSNGVAWHPTGLRLEVSKAGGESKNRVLVIADLNPDARIVHVMTRWSCFCLGLLIAWRGIWARTPHEQVKQEMKRTRR